MPKQGVGLYSKLDDIIKTANRIQMKSQKIVHLH